MILMAGNDFNRPEAIIELGVGKKMVASIRFWLKVFDITKNEEISWPDKYLFDESKGKAQVPVENGLYVMTHSSTHYRKKQLNKIAKELCVKIKVEEIIG